MLSALRRASSLNNHLRPFSRNMSTVNEAALAKGPEALRKPGLVFLVAQTPNGNKPLYMAEELKASNQLKDYEVIPTSFSKNEQKEPWFEAVNPNGRIPALRDNREGKQPINVWESASILLYLAKTYDLQGKFWFKDDEDLQTELLNWIFFIQGGVGPMQGYQNESARLYGVYESHLSGAKDGEKKEYLVGGKYTIADMCTQPWIRMAIWAGVDIEPFPHLKAWVPEQDMLSKIKGNPEEAKRLAEESSKWVMASNQKK
ncbi:Glutathione S-transferase 2 [Rhodosporidiobolus nylandii]